MTQNVDRETVVSRLLGTDDILILCHKNPDGDTIGSGAALCKALQHLGKTAAVLCSDPIPAMYDYMQITVYDGSFTPAFVVAVDVAGIQLFGDHNNIQDYAEHVDLCIDHHGSNSGYAYETLVDDHAAAAAELLTGLIPQMGVELTPDIAACLYTGVATDTGCFRFTNTTANTHLAAAKLIEAGADVEKLNELLFECRSHARVQAEKMALESLEFYYDDRCALICLTWDQIQAAGVQRGHHGGVVLTDLVGHLVQLGLLAVVIGVLLQHHVLLHAAGDILEGAGADGLGCLIGVVLGHDVDVGHIADEVAVGGGQGKADLIALSLGVHDSRKRLCHSGVHCVSGAGFKGIEHVVHGALSTIVEHHTVTKGEGVGQLVVRNGMLGSDSIDEVTVRVGLHKALKDVKHDLSSSCGRHLIRVKTIIQVLGNTHVDLVCMVLLTINRVLPGRSARFVAGFGSLIRCPSARAE